MTLSRGSQPLRDPSRGRGARRQCQHVVLAVCVSPPHLSDLEILRQLDDLRGLVVFLALVNVELESLQSEVPLRPVGILGEHHFEVIDGFVLAHLQEACDILRLELPLDLLLLVAFDVVEAEPDW